MPKKEEKNIIHPSNNDPYIKDIYYIDQYSFQEEIQNTITKLSKDDSSITKIYINISDTNILAPLGEAIKHNTKVIFCEFKCDIPNFFTSYITNILKDSKSLNNFSFNNSKFSNNDIVHIAQALSTNTNITSLSLEGNSLTTEAVEIIISAIHYHPSIQLLTLSLVKI